MALDEWYQWVVEQSTYSLDFWNKYDYIVILITLIGYALGPDNKETAQLIRACNVVLIWCRSLKYLQLSKEVGVLVIMIMVRRMYSNPY